MGRPRSGNSVFLFVLFSALLLGLTGCRTKQLPERADGSSNGLSPTLSSAPAQNKGVQEVSLEVSAGEYPLSARLTLPDSMEKVPAVILLHGSGVNDMDETVHSNKLFRDLAQGLAQRGIAVLRYNKRSYQYHDELLEIPAGVEEDALEDALAGYRLLRERPEVDMSRIYYAGHSQGGGFTGVLAQREPDVRGVISLAGTPRRLEDITYEQYKRMNLTEDQLAQVRAIVQAIKALDSKEEPDPFFYYWGASELYWKTLNSLDISGDMKKTAESRPVLILQGERDCQVFMEDFALWKELLGEDNPQVTYRSYPKLNHLFLEGEGEPNAEEYEIPGQVPGYVMDDIADWIFCDR